MPTRKNFLNRSKQRREEAEIRQDEYDALTPAQKITRAQSRVGNSKKELGRLGVITE